MNTYLMIQSLKRALQSSIIVKVKLFNKENKITVTVDELRENHIALIRKFKRIVKFL